MNAVFVRRVLGEAVGSAARHAMQRDMRVSTSASARSALPQRRTYSTGIENRHHRWRSLVHDPRYAVPRRRRPTAWPQLGRDEMLELSAISPTTKRSTDSFVAHCLPDGRVPWATRSCGMDKGRDSPRRSDFRARDEAAAWGASTNCASRRPATWEAFVEHLRKSSSNASQHDEDVIARFVPGEGCAQQMFAMA